MFQLLKNPKFDFMKRGRLLLIVSGVLVAASLVVLLANGLNLGIEFTGGTEVQIKYLATPDVGEIRRTLEGAGMKAQVTTIGAPEENEVYIRIAEGAPGEADEVTGLVSRTLRGDAVEPGKVDLNIAGENAIRDLLLSAPGVTATQAVQIAEAMADRRKDVAIYGSVDELREIPGMTAGAADHLESQMYTGPLALRSQSYIGPAVGAELMKKAQLAITMSLLMMLGYIWIRFQLQWGFAAVVALTHDTLITLGLFSLFNKEMSLPVVAAFLTLVGYSVNDTVVVFDRIRENIKNNAARGFAETINLSINQTLGRTIITSGLTWVVVFGLFLYGGAALNPFAFVLSVGVIVGTYSSIFIASPLVMLWGEAKGKTGTRSADSPTATRVRKVRTPTS